MSFNFKEIYIGKLIEQQVIESDISMERMMNFMKCSKEEIENVYKDMVPDLKMIIFRYKMHWILKIQLTF